MFVRRTLSAGTLAVVATACLATMTTSAMADAKTPTTLGIREAKQVIALGGTNVVSGQLVARGQGPVAGADVDLLKKRAGAAQWMTVRHKATNEKGVVAFVVSPRRTVRFELVFRGDSTHFPTRSGIVTTTVVRRLPTAIGIRVSPQSITPGGTATIDGRLHLRRSTGRPRGLPNEQVTLQQKNADSTWQPVATATTDGNGVVHFTVSPAQTTRYAIFFAPTDRFQGSRSQGVDVAVGQPTTLSITTSAASVDPGDTVTVQGVLTENGQPLPGQAIELRARPAHTNKPFTTVATGTTASDGTVALTDMPTVDTIYRLLFRHTAGDATALSPAARVLVRLPSSLSIRLDGSTVRGTLFGPRNHPLPDREVTLQSSPAGTATWTDVASSKTGQNGGVAFAVSPTAATDYRLVFAATPRYQSCQSGVVTVG